ncbi:unnamed protein product [Acidithrix sp. C25]|nr:unnamed protein product [Acidithrix sp. C25]
MLRKSLNENLRSKLKAAHKMQIPEQKQHGLSQTSPNPIRSPIVRLSKLQSFHRGRSIR